MKKILVFILISVLSCQCIYAAPKKTDKFKNKPKAKICVETHKGQCVKKSQIKPGQFQIATSKGDVFCENDEVCVSGNITTDPVKTTSDKSNTPASSNPVADGKVSDFCKNNPTRAEIQAGNLKSKINSNITYDSSVMSQEECHVWVKGTPEQYQEYVVKNDPEVNREYKTILEHMKEKMTDPELKSNIEKAISDIDKTVTSQTKAAQDVISKTLAPSQNKATNNNSNNKYPFTEADKTTAGIKSKDDYKAICKANNGVGINADVENYFSPTIVYVSKGAYPSLYRCPAGYVENGLQYSIALDIGCCRKDESVFNYCTYKNAVVKYADECSVQNMPVYTGLSSWVCCPANAIKSTSVQVPAQSTSIVNTNIIGTDINSPIEYQTLCRLNYPTTSTYTVPGKICNSGYTQGIVGQNGIVGYNSKIGETCCIKIK